MPALQFPVSEADLETLNYERYHYPDPLCQKRLQAVYLKAKLDMSNRAVGLACGLHPNSVAICLKAYKGGGIPALKTNNYGTNRSCLEACAPDLLSAFNQEPPRSAAEAAERIGQLTGLRLSATRVRAFMKRHGLAYRKCGHIPAKADPEKQQQWVETALNPAMEAAAEGKIHLLFCDAAHFVLHPFICFLWSAVRVFIKGSAGRNRINVLGAVDAITKEVTTLINDTYVTADTLVAFLKMLREKYCDQKQIAIVLDNARYQHCAVVKTFAASVGIHLLYLPPYSPNLNITERLWKFTKKKILHARYYDKPAAFHQAIRDFFANINNQYNEQLQSLLSLKFQLFNNSLFYPA